MLNSESASAATRSPMQRVTERVRAVYGNWRRDTSIAQMRADWDALFWNESQCGVWKDTELGGVCVRWLGAHSRLLSEPRRTLIWFHGGGYTMGSVTSHHDLMIRLSAAAECRVLGVEYRLCPEFGFPAPIEDGLAVYRALLASGCRPSDISVGGDSAGGGIAAALMLTLRDAGLEQPASAVLLSAWLDMTLSGASYDTCSKSDPVHQRAMLAGLAARYLGESVTADSPLASPALADLAGLPPILLQASDAEIGVDDSRLFARRAAAAGCEVTLSLWPGLIHVFQQFADDLPEAGQAIAEIGAFLVRQWRDRSDKTGVST